MVREVDGAAPLYLPRAAWRCLEAASRALGGSVTTQREAAALAQLFLSDVNFVATTRSDKTLADGDALLHTVTDAILGALGRPDIGQLFPDNDPKWKGQTSDVFVKEAVSLFFFFCC